MARQDDLILVDQVERGAHNGGHARCVHDDMS